jgi:ELP3 family radical SAM enzyme/protein acetyltransferase
VGRIFFKIHKMSCSTIADIESIGSASGKSKIEFEQQTASKQKPISKETLRKFVGEFMDAVSKKGANLNKSDIDKIFERLRRVYRIMPNKHDIRFVSEEYFNGRSMPLIFTKWLVKRASRADSGILVATITLAPDKFSCEYNCAMCPQETDLQGNRTQPRSYLSTEPAMLRAIASDFDIKRQFQNRIQAYKYNGCIKNGDVRSKKMEVILSGGTWHSYPKAYRYQVATEVYWAANTVNEERPIKTLAEEILENETAEYRIIGLTGETRPDKITKETIVEALEQGFTRWQLGEQSDDDAILKLINRKCYVADTILAHRLLKQAGFKIVAHLMPDLPGSTPVRDVEMFQNYLTNPDLQFDDVKIYPTAICVSPTPDRIVKSKIADWYISGRYKPYAELNLQLLLDAIIYYKVRVPPWVRIQRIVRDIPSKSITAGYNKLSNLRQVIHEKMAAAGQVCNCIYCKEIGDNELDESLTPILVVRKYTASSGTEYHLSMEAHKMTMGQQAQYMVDRGFNLMNWLLTGRWSHWEGSLNSYVGLYGFCRLRDDPDPGGDFVPEINGCALIREVHVYGFALGVGTDAFGSQHRGYGKKLVKTAEQIAAYLGYKKAAVIAGVGTREYYKNKCGYEKATNYMVKNIPDYDYKTSIRMGILMLAGFFLAKNLFRI